MSISNLDNSIYSLNRTVNSVEGNSGKPTKSEGAVDSSDTAFRQVLSTVVNATTYKSANTTASTPDINNTNGIETKTSETVEPAEAKAAAKVVDLDSIFQKAAETYDVPVSLLKAMAKAESNFNVNAVSSCGAMGVMQLMPSTAKALGVSDAFDPEQNIMGGAKYISGKLQQYDGDVVLALASYNAGSGNVKKYGGVPPFTETRNYISKVTGYMGSDISAGTTVINSNANALSDSLNAYVARATGTTAGSTAASSGENSSNAELLELYNALLGASSIGGNKSNLSSLSTLTDLMSGSDISSESDISALAEQLLGSGTTSSSFASNLLANSNMSLETLASTGLMSDWLAAASLSEEEEDSGFYDLINAYTRYNRLTLNPEIDSKNTDNSSEKA